jgi:hypothetical protein
LLCHFGAGDGCCLSPHLSHAIYACNPRKLHQVALRPCGWVTVNATLSGLYMLASCAYRNFSCNTRRPQPPSKDTNNELNHRADMGYLQGRGMHHRAQNRLQDNARQGDSGAFAWTERLEYTGLACMAQWQIHAHPCAFCSWLAGGIWAWSTCDFIHSQRRNPFYSPGQVFGGSMHLLLVSEGGEVAWKHEH